MARKVFLHVGLPKTGTTYLQSIAWANKLVLREQGVLLPGFGPRQHLWASGVVREEKRLERRHPDAHLAWEQLTDDARNWTGTALISHEFFAGASEAQVRTALKDLDDVKSAIPAGKVADDDKVKAALAALAALRPELAE